jgi:hypothetical protein
MLTTPAKTSILDRLVKGRVAKPAYLLVYGTPGVGKSTFASTAPDPLFIDADNRTGHLDVNRITPKSWADILEILAAVHTGELPCKTLVVDTLDHAEMALHAHLCKAAGVTNLEEIGGGYGKGAVAALAQWRYFALECERIRKAGKNVVLLAHTQLKVLQNPLGEDYARHEIKLDKKAHGFLREKVDAVGFADFEVFAKKSRDGKVKATGTGHALIRFAPSPAYESKRFEAFPEVCEMRWDALINSNKGANK